MCVSKGNKVSENRVYLSMCERLWTAVNGQLSFGVKCPFMVYHIFLYIFKRSLGKRQITKSYMRTHWAICLRAFIGYLGNHSNFRERSLTQISLTLDRAVDPPSHKQRLSRP